MPRRHDLAHRRRRYRSPDVGALALVQRPHAHEDDADRGPAAARLSMAKDSVSRPSAAPSGIPWTFPLGVVAGVFRSPCASNQIAPPLRPVHRRHSAEGPERDRVVAVQDDRRGPPRLHTCDGAGDALAGLLDLGKGVPSDRRWRSPRRRQSARCPSRRSRSPARRGGCRDPRTGSPTAPCRHLAGLPRDRAQRR